MAGADAYELKHDASSTYSMDSAYQSQSGASRGGATIPEGYQSHAPQDTRSRLSSQFLGSDMYSPTLSSETYNGYPEQPPDMHQVQLPSAAGDLESGEDTFAYANYTTGQDYSHFTATSLPRSGAEMGFHWGTTDPQPFAFNFAQYPNKSNSMDATLYASQDNSDFMFNAPTPVQRHSMSGHRLDTTVRPTVVRAQSSYLINQPGPRRISTHDPAVAGFVMSPSSAISTHTPTGTSYDFEQQHLETRSENEDTRTASLAGQSVVDEDELLSPSDAAAAKNMEEEQGKAARSHPLYQALPDKDGKYRCPKEGKPGCTHKPTTLKCNYDKYVDSHLKPFRCNKKVCVGVQFSSTACLLRHEREAHGMHGHGSRPHLCHFTDCDRSLSGNGFPRRYNLYDHMKRVHDFTNPVAEPSPPAPAAPKAKSTNRKRKSTADEGGEKRQKVTKPTLQQQLAQRRVKLQEDFLAKKQNIVSILSNLGGPNDLRDDIHIQLNKEILSLHEMSAEFKKNLGG